MIATADSAAEQELGLKHKYYFCGDSRASLVLLVHGRAGTYDVMWAFRRCLPEKCNIIAVQAPEPDELGGYSWWQIDNQKTTREAVSAGMKRLSDFISRMERYYSLTPTKRAALGFSQGAGILSLLIQETSQSFDAVALLAGFVIEGLGPDLPAKRPEILVLHGSLDDIVPVERAHVGRALLQGRGYSVVFHEDPVGHKVGVPGMRLLREWLSTRI